MNIESSNFLHSLARQNNISLVTTKCSPSGRCQDQMTSQLFGKKVLISRKRCKIEIYFNGRLIGNRIWPIKWQQRRWPSMTFKVIHRLHAFSNAIRRTFMQNFKRIQLTVCSRSLYVSWSSRMNRESTDKRIVYARNTEVDNNETGKVLFVNLRPLDMQQVRIT